MQIVVTGANRGLGLGFARYYLERGHEVWACYRSDPGDLAAMATDKLHLVQWDVAKPRPQSQVHWPQRIDLLINNAGIYGPGKDAQSLAKITPAVMLEVFNVDCVGPLRVVQHLLPRIVAGRGVIANISSKMGSIRDNASGGTYAYRAAKAALVMVSKSMAVDLAPLGVHVIVLHPGWVKTGMTGYSGLIDVATSVAGMTRIIENAREYAGGSFIAYDGQPVPY